MLGILKQKVMYPGIEFWPFVRSNSKKILNLMKHGLPWHRYPYPVTYFNRLPSRIGIGADPDPGIHTSD
jgi:hypothetical protein